MTDSYTPGPWFVETCHVGEKCWCRTITTKEGSDSMEHCIIPSGAVGTANAALIGAAPELLVMLQRMALHVRPTCTELYDEAMLIIAKATGK